MIAVDSPSYHAHVYFTPESEPIAAALRDQACVALAGRAWVHPLVPRPVGPHPVPMFEINFAHDQRDAVISWLDAHHGELSVLLHPLTEDELADHTLHVAWLGESQPLDLSKL